MHMHVQYLYLPVRVSTAQSLRGDGEGWPHRVQGVLDVLKIYECNDNTITVDQNSKEVNQYENTLIVIQRMQMCTCADAVASSVFGYSG